MKYNNYIQIIRNKAAAKMHNMSAESINQANQYDYEEATIKNKVTFKV